MKISLDKGTETEGIAEFNQTPREAPQGGPAGSNGGIDLMEGIFLHMAGAVFVVDPDGRIRQVNPAVTALLGFTKEELLASYPWTFLTGVSREETLELMQAILPDVPTTQQQVCRGKDGEQKSLELRWTRCSSFNRELIIVSCRDVTEQKRLEDRLRQSEQNLAEGQRLTKTGSWVLDYLTGETDWSVGTCRMFGFPDPPPSPKYSEFRERVSPEDREKVDRLLGECFVTGEPRPLHYRFVLPNGITKCIQTMAQAIRDESGVIRKLMGTTMDVTERVQTEEELRKNETLLAGEKRLLEMAARGDSLLLILEAACQFVEELCHGSLCSIQLLEEKTERLWNHASPHLPSGYIESINGVRIGPKVGSCGTAAYLGKQVIVADIATDPLWENYRHHALEIGLRACWSTPIFSTEKHILGTFAMYYHTIKTPSGECQEIIQHITHLVSLCIERDRTEAALRQSKTYLTEAQKLSRTGSFVWKMSTGTTHWSAETYHIFECDERTEPSVALVLEHVHPEDRARVQEVIQRYSIEAGDWEIEHRLLLPSGTIKYLHVRARATKDVSGNLECVGALMDVTERKRAEAALRQAQVHLAHMTRLTTIGELTASIAHEVNQPLAAIVTNANACLRWLERENPNLTEAREAVQRIIRDGNRGSNVISRIRALLRKEPPSRRGLNINEVIGETINLVQSDWEGIALRLELGSDLPLVYADRVELQQVLFNLIINATESMKEAKERSHILSIETGRHEQKAILIAIRDTGVGIRPEVMDHLFEALYTTKPEGLGLGLSISRSIIEGYGGSLWANPNEDWGSTFQFTLPIESNGKV